MHQQILIPAVLDLVQLHIEFQLFFRPFPLQRQNGLPHLLIEPEACLLRPDGLIVQLGQQQNVSRQRGQAAGVKEDLLNIGLLLRLRLLVILQKRGIALDGVDRRLELV